METVKIGTRGSLLAMWQTNFVAEQIRKFFPDVAIEIVKISTKGDRVLDSPLSKIGGKGLFTKEIEYAILNHEVDLAVHSLKDLPTKMPDGLILGAVTTREDPRDAFVSKKFSSFEKLPTGAKIGTSSLRRRAQIQHLRPDLIIENLRGNVQTRLKKLDEFDAIILAVAGLKRLELEDRITEIFSTEKILPAVGQGAIAIEIRDDDPKIQHMIEFLNDDSTFIETSAERAFLDRVGGSCQVPIGVFGKIHDDTLNLEAVISSIDGKNFLREHISGNKKIAHELGQSLADHLISMGGSKILNELTN